VALVSDKTKRVRGVYARRAIQIDDLYLYQGQKVAFEVKTKAMTVFFEAKAKTRPFQGQGHYFLSSSSPQGLRISEYIIQSNSFSKLQTLTVARWSFLK